MRQVDTDQLGAARNARGVVHDYHHVGVRLERELGGVIVGLVAGRWLGRDVTVRGSTARWIYELRRRFDGEAVRVPACSE